ncbi:hypothetical protein ACFV30_31375 [Streptomyces sp. NPDC059752]|uniref:hypothetical protein n=1 Tax=unclassified Streptomyces TaxID=2593676 RepID=UPI00365821FD
MNSSPSNSFDNDDSGEIGAMPMPFTEMLDQAKAEAEAKAGITVTPQTVYGDLDAMNDTYAEMLDKAEADIALLQRAVKRRRKALRRHKRRQIAARATVYRRPALIMLGISFFTIGVIMLVTGQPNAMDMFDRAMTAWNAAFVIRPRA